MVGAQSVHNIKQCGAVILVATCKPIDHDITQGTDDDTLHRVSIMNGHSGTAPCHLLNFIIMRCGMKSKSW